MPQRKRLIGSIKKELLFKAREAALCAIKVFNDPLVRFKSETYIVLMIIAWTYLLHAYYRSKRIDYRYFKRGPKRKRYDKTKYGAKKHWELEKCLNHEACTIDRDTQNNLRFLIGLRHEIEHQMTSTLDNFLSGRYQACAINFNNYLKDLFGTKYALDPFLTYSIQFTKVDERQFQRVSETEEIPPHLRTYIANFDGALTQDEYNSPRFSYRLIFRRKLVNRPGQADKVIEFVDPDSELAKSIDKEFWVKKEVERQKYRAKDIVNEVHKKGFTNFRVNPEHLRMWKSEDAKNPAKGYGTPVAGFWYWYDTWLKRALELCAAAGDKYK